MAPDRGEVVRRISLLRGWVNKGVGLDWGATPPAAVSLLFCLRGQWRGRRSIMRWLLSVCPRFGRRPLQIETPAYLTLR
jgi:hypothetical protein